MSKQNDHSEEPSGDKPAIGGVTRRRLLKTAAAGVVSLAFSPTHAALPKPAALPAAPADKVKPVVPNAALPFDLADIRLLPGPFKHAQDLDGAYLLFLEPDRFLHNFRVNAGLPPKADIYGGWENQGVAGHTGGHYLSACALMYRATGDPRFRRKADYMVGELALCQQKSSDGLVTAIPDARTIFAKVAADGTVTGWVPWYTMHKLCAGLRDTYRNCGNGQARDVLIGLADWAIGLTKNLTDAQFQGMLETEHGGMAESLSDVYAITGDPKYLTLARRFTHHAVFDPLAARQDRLDGLHSNTQIPKMIGYARFHELTGEQPYGEAPRFFWQTVVGTRTYANGGNGDYEHFFPITEFKNHIHSDTATETCCTYNMLKLTNAQFQKDPQGHYADYYECALLNNILASQDPVGGMMTYHSPMKPGHFKVYSDPLNAFWCCVGTGIENHARYGEALYFHSPDDGALYVNQFLPSALNWRQKGVTLRQETRFPESDTTRLQLACVRPTAFALKIRRPAWAQGMTVTVNGKAFTGLEAGGYLTLDRTWHSGDAVEVRLPMVLRLEPLPHTPEKQAVMYGPLLLVGALGREGMDKLPDIATNQAPYDNLPALTAAAFVAAPGEVARRIRPVPGQPLTFRTASLGQPGDVTLIPYYQMHHQRYNTYWSVYSPADWAAHKAELAAGEAQQRALDARTVDRFLPGDQQSEVDHHFVGQNSGRGDFDSRAWRDAADGGWLSFALKTDPAAAPMELLCTYWGSDGGGRIFDVLVDEVVIGSQTLENNQPGEFFDAAYPIPPALLAGKTSIVVKLQAKPGMRAGGLFGCRIMRK